MRRQNRSRAWPWRILLAFALLLPALAARAEERMPGLEMATELLRLGDAPAILTLPPGVASERRLPVVLLLPDTDGPGPRSALYGQRLLENGFALLEPDFAGAAPEGTPPPPPATRLRLALSAIAADPRLDPQHVAVLGLGEGARAALFGLAAGAPTPTLALLYPGCDAALAAAARQAPGTARVLLLHGDADTANDSAACAHLTAAFPVTAGVAHRVLAGATYGWDAYDLVPPGGATRLADPAGEGRRAWSRPDLTTTQVAADRVLGFVLGSVAAR